MAKNTEVKVTFKAFNKDFNKAVNEMKKASSTLRQELKLEQTQLRMNGTEQQKLQATVTSLSKQYEVAKKRTQETADQLEKVKQQFGENSNAAKNMETELRRAQIAEQEIANRLEITSQKLEEATRAEKERASEVGKAKEKLKELQREEERLAQTSDNLTKKYEMEKAALGNNASETKKAKLEYNHLKEAKKVAAEQTENLRQQLENAKTAYGENSREVQELEGKLYDAAKAEQEIINRSAELERQVGNAFKAAGSEVKEFGDKMQEAGRKATDVGKNLSMKVTAPIAAFGALAIKSGMEFEGSMSNVAAISGATGKDLAELEDKAREMGESTNKSATEAADAMSYMALAGWDNKQMIEGIEPVLKLSAAGNIDLAKTSDIVTDSMSAMGIEIDELEDYLDVMAQAARSSNTDVDEMGEAFVTSGGKLRSLGIDFKEGGIALGLMANAGVKGAEAGRGLSAILTRLTSPTGQAKKALEKLGVSAFDANGEFIGIEETLRLVEKSMQGMTQEQKTTYKSMIAGQEHEKTFSALINSLGDNYDSLTKDIKNANGAMDEMYDVMTDNLQGELDTLSSKFEALQLSIYKKIVPVLTQFVQKLQILVTWLNNLSPTVQMVIIVIAAIAAAMGPLLIIFGQVAIGLGAIVKLFGSMLTVIGNLGSGLGVLGGAFKLLLGPIGIVIAVITALIATFVHMYRTNEEFREKVNEVWTAVTETIGQAIEAISVFIKEVFGSVVSWWKENQESIRTATSNVWSWIQEFLSITFDVIVGIFQFVWPLIKLIIIDTWNAIQNVIKGALNIIQGVIKTFSSLFTGDWKGLWEGIKQILSGAVQLIWGLVNLWFVGKILKLGKTFMKLFQNVFKSGWNLIRNIFSSSTSAVRNVVNTGFNAIRSVITTIMNAIRSVITSVWNGIRSVITSVMNGIRSVITSIWNGIKSVITRVVTGIKTTVTNQFNAIKSSATRIFNAVKTAMTKPVEAAKNTIKRAVDAIKGFFSGMKLKIPKIQMPKLPKFTLKGNFSLKPPSVPKIGVNWNAKGGIFTRPTIFNTANAGLQGVGEAGPEAILPLNDKVLGTIGRMIADLMPNNQTNTNQIIVNATVRNDQDIDKLTNKIDRKLNDFAERKKNAWGG